jgi:hypothetical protein
MAHALDCNDGIGVIVDISVGSSGGGDTPAKILKNGQTGAGNRLMFNTEGGYRTVAYAAAVTPDPLRGSTHKIGTLTGNITINDPATTLITANYLHAGMETTLVLTQDATGGRTVTFGSAFKTTAAVPTTADSTTTVTFVYDGTYWREKNRATT